MKKEIEDFVFTGDREAADAVHARKNMIPRAVIRSTFIQMLDGDWKFAHDPKNCGMADHWAKGHDYRHTVQWPGSIEQHLAAVQETRPTVPGPQWQDKVVVWYECDFAQPPHLNLARESLQLTFGASGYETRVWLNGIPLKTIEGADAHLGEYTSFSYELPAEALQSSNRLTVRISASMDAEIPRGKQESHVYKRGGIWYQTYTGAVRSVWLETVERNRLRSRVSVVSAVEDHLVRFNFTTRIHDAGAYVLYLKIYGHPPLGGVRTEPVAKANFPLQLEVGEKFQRVVVELPNARLWSPSNPNLYLLVAQLIDADGHAAQIETHFGLRKIEARGRYVYLNNQAVYLDGILYQPGMATYEEMRRHMLAVQKLGCNLVRIHIAGIDPRICNLADETGLMLWVEVPSPHASTSLSRENHLAELKRMLSLIESHPSVVIWSLYNEDWGVEDIASNRRAQQYITDTYHYMLIHHPQFLVVDNDGWQHVSWEGRLKSDLLTAHLYTPDLTRWQGLLAQLGQGDMDGVAVKPLVIGDPFFYRGQVPLVVSEWGGFGFADYGGPQGSLERADRIGLFKKELRKVRVAGDVYTQATDIEDERNGLIDAPTGDLKVPPGILSSREIPWPL